MLSFGITEAKITKWREEKNLKKLKKALGSNKANIQSAAISALLEIAQPESFEMLEPVINKCAKETQLTIAEGYKQAGYQPKDVDVLLRTHFLLQDKPALVESGKKAIPFLTQELSQAGTESAAYAAEILTEMKWKPGKNKEKAHFYLATNQIEKIKELGAEVIPIVDEYLQAQKDPALRRQSLEAIIGMDTGKLMPLLKKYENDPDEEIVNMIKHRMDAIKKVEVVEKNKNKWKSFFKSPVSNSTELTATKFIKMGLNYLEHNLYYEAFCAFAVADYIYEKLTGGYVIKEGLTIGDLHTQRDREIKVFGDFKLETVLEQISEKIRGVLQQSSILNLLFSNPQTSSELSSERGSLKQILESNQVHDSELLEATIKFLISHENDSRRAWRAIINLPDKRCVASLIDAFKLADFVFDPIQSLIYIGEDAVPELLECLESKDYKLRANAAFALGMIEEGVEAEQINKLLKKEKHDYVKINYYFILARLGKQNGNVDNLFKNLEVDSENLRQCAARCLRHLKMDVDVNRYLKYLADADEIIRIMAVQCITDSEKELPEDILQELIQRLKSESKDFVREKLVSGLSERKEESLPKLLLAELPSANNKMKENIVSILGNLKATESTESLLKLWSKANKDLKRSLIWTYGQLGAIDSLKNISRTLQSNADLRRLAAFGMVFLSDADVKAVKAELKGIHNSEATMAKAILGEKSAIQSIRSGLSSYQGIQEIFESLDSAMIVKSSEFIRPLYGLTEYSNQDYYPTDRYVRYSAIQCLVKIFLAQN